MSINLNNIFVDDGSKDKSLEIMKDLHKEDKKGFIIYLFTKFWKRSSDVT